jgi:hypothetical protein
MRRGGIRAPPDDHFCPRSILGRSGRMVAPGGMVEGARRHCSRAAGRRRARVFLGSGRVSQHARAQGSPSDGLAPGLASPWDSICAMAGASGAEGTGRAVRLAQGLGGAI